MHLCTLISFFVYSENMFLESNIDPKPCLPLRPHLGCPPHQSPHSDGTGHVCGPHCELFPASGSFLLYPAALTPMTPLEKSPWPRVLKQPHCPQSLTVTSLCSFLGSIYHYPKWAHFWISSLFLAPLLWQNVRLDLSHPVYLHFSSAYDRLWRKASPRLIFVEWVILFFFF